MANRRFPTDTELDRVLAALPEVADATPTPILDQIDAATRDLVGMSQTMALAAFARGEQAYLSTLPAELEARRRLIRPRLKMLLAAFSADVAHLCEHTQQVRPVLLSCDPPALACMQPACLAAVDRHAQTVGHRWDHQCDGCGRPSELVFPYVTTFGPLTISGHLCEPCTQAMTAEAAPVTDDYATASRKGPCPCGSGRRYKRCHGRAA
ncbi:SEC-C metal-binding domain-containing protein [Streptomyces parvulus]|uniref:SEC-C metal-binding domain-containing protein n=1 Tax=Streptomyces parvulus TaxID=146923 RepID=UPI0037A4ECC6